MGEKHLFTNRLVLEKSPYLLQHAHNPVDWYPWSQEAFQAAQDQDKPIFLSIGYATCHWCHTMERESFENQKVAQLMNETFINIKVDREELPEIDSLYMDFAQSMMAGSAGWPLNVILTPSLEPFFAATYLPPVTRHGMMGLMDLIERIGEVWKGEEREKVEQQASKIVEIFAENMHVRGDEMPRKEQITDVADLLFKIADPVYGGLKGAPKFPVGYQYNFLLAYSATMKDSRALFLVERTLDMMQRGGINDHIGGGFSRYSVDERWVVPHFEKMLYDNALLTESNNDAWRLTKKELYKKVALDICRYILRDMTHPKGAFYSAEDADSDGQEGLFYTWEYAELEKLLGKDKLALFADFYGVTQEGNFEGRNVLYTPLKLEEYALKHKLDASRIEAELEEDRKLLFEVRNKRNHPFKDDKILTSWNGLMIHALAEAGAAFNAPNLIIAAAEAAQFLKKQLWKENELLHRWRENDASYSGGLDDYAFLIRGLITLFELGEGSDHLEWAMQLTDIVERDFKAENGAYYQSNGRDSSIILRKCQLADGAEPSGNAVHCENLLKLYQLTGNDKYREQAEDVFKSVKKYLDNYSPGYFYHIMNLARYFNAHKPAIIVALNAQHSHEDELKKAINEQYIPHKTVIWLNPDDPRLLALIPGLESYKPKEGKTTLFICFDGACQEPLMDLNKMIEAIQKL